MTAESRTGDLGQVLCEMGAAEGLSITYRRWLPGDRSCDCEIGAHHRWNCALTPIWVQTIRDLDANPWTVVTDAMSLGINMPDGSARLLLQIRDYAPGSAS